jgi:CBS domain-containing protein
MKTIREVMRTDLVTVGPTVTLLEAAHAMSMRHAGSVLVLEDGTLVGIFTERDLMRAMAESSTADAARVSSVSGWMTRSPATIGTETTVGAALDLMLSGGFRHLPVMEAETLVGIVSMRDLVQAIAR